MLELDHVFAMVTDPGQAAGRLEEHGWVLDVGQAHRGQGTRNRRLVWPEAYFELLWLTDAAEAAANPLRLDRRAAWTTAGASPFGVAFRGQIESADRDEFWLYDALGPRMWIHRDNERFPERALVLVLEVDREQMQRRRSRASMSNAAHRQPGELRELRLRGPSAPSVPAFAGPPLVCEPGPHGFQVVVGNEAPGVLVSGGLVTCG